MSELKRKGVKLMPENFFVMIQICYFHIESHNTHAWRVAS